MLNVEIFCNILFFYIEEINNAENYENIGRTVSELNTKEKREVFEVIKSEFHVNINLI